MVSVTKAGRKTSCSITELEETFTVKQNFKNHVYAVEALMVLAMQTWTKSFSLQPLLSETGHTQRVRKWNYTTSVYLLTSRYQGLFPWQKRTWDMKLMLKAWMFGAISPNIPHTFTTWCFIKKRIDFTLPHKISHFFKRKCYHYLHPNPSQNVAPEHNLNIYISALNRYGSHSRNGQNYVPPIREQSQNYLKHFKTYTGTQKPLVGNRRSRLDVTHALSFIRVRTRWWIWQNYQQFI